MRIAGIREKGAWLRDKLRLDYLSNDMDGMHARFYYQDKKGTD